MSTVARQCASPQSRAARLRLGLWQDGRAGLLLVLLTYLLLYGWLLIRTDFLPYVYDNNESFSSLWHAYSLYHFDIRDSAGLTDEAFSPHPEAHPFVHTHQGNAPRLFAYVLYVLGARTIESQIALTALFIGSATVAIAYRLFMRLVGPLFATVACLTLITDYVFFGQWAVVTYRIWHFFFVFGALLCAVEIGGRQLRRWAVATVLLYALLFYFELVFAGFTAIFAGLFTGWRLRRQVKRLALAWALQLAGAMAGIGVLAAQLTAYLGWRVALEDFYLTFVARNAAATDPALREYMTQFFLSHNVIFWQNVVDARSFRSVEQFTLLLTSWHWQWYTPLVSLLTFVLLAGWLLGLVADGAGSLLSVRQAPALDGRGPGLLDWLRAGVVVADLGAATLFLALTLLRDEAFLGLPVTGESFARRTGGLGWFGVAAIGAVALLATWNGARDWRVLVRALAGVSLARAVLAAAFLLAAAFAVREQSYLFLQSYAPIWYGLASQIVPLWLSRCAVAVMLGLAAVLVLAGPARVLGSERASRLRALAAYLVCGTVAYTTVFLISPGYVYSGYLTRFAPLAVFVANVAVAAAIYLVLAATMQAVSSLRVQRGLIKRAPLTLLGPAVRTALLVAGLLFFVGFWLNVQRVSLTVLPPNSFAFLKMLGQPPYRGATLASNFYVAPMTAYTGEWGYTDTTLARGNTWLSDDGYVVERGTGQYLWLRDRETNPDYLEPDYYICLRPQTPFTVLKAVTGEYQDIEGCEVVPLVSKAQAGTLEYLHHTVVARDSGPLDSWAIIKMDWDYPPFLRPLGSGSGRAFVDVVQIEEADRLILRVRYEYAQQKRVPEQGTVLRLEGLGPDGQVCTLAEQTGSDTLTVPAGVRGRIRVIVTPHTATKAGPEYDSAITAVGDPDANPCGQ
ncbi:MAG: hypothetical protein AB7K36_02635 [Chloroflexota bacterium]